jgi:hypothetical protein
MPRENEHAIMANVKDVDGLTNDTWTRTRKESRQRSAGTFQARPYREATYTPVKKDRVRE